MVYRLWNIIAESHDKSGIACGTDFMSLDLSPVHQLLACGTISGTPVITRDLIFRQSDGVRTIDAIRFCMIIRGSAIGREDSILEIMRRSYQLDIQFCLEPTKSPITR